MGGVGRIILGAPRPMELRVRAYFHSRTTKFWSEKGQDSYQTYS